MAPPPRTGHRPEKAVGYCGKDLADAHGTNREVLTHSLVGDRGKGEEHSRERVGLLDWVVLGLAY